MSMSLTPQVSLAVVAYNAAAALPALLGDLRKQTFPGDRLEILLIDSASTDGTRAVMEAFAAEPAPYAVRVLDNPGRILACGCNVALANSRGDFLLRLDAHASVPPDFLATNVAALEAGYDVVGGQVATAPPRTAQEAPLARLDASRFAGGAAAFRNPGAARNVDALAYPLVRRAVYDKVGSYDERLVRTEDNDMAYRMRQAGYVLRYDPSIRSWHRARNSLGKLLRQKHENGRWIGLTLPLLPKGFAIRHFVPLAFVLVLVLALLLALWGVPWCLWALLAVYGACDLAFSALEAHRSPIARWRCCLNLPWMFPLVHLLYGIGTLRGLLSAPKLAAKPVHNHQKEDV